MKWLFTDFDGTLSNSKDGSFQITKEDLKFVKDWQNQGNKLVIATGRPYCRIAGFVREKYDLHPDFFITNTGASIYDDKDNPLFLNYLSEKTKAVFLKFLAKNKNKITSATYALKDDENFFFNNDSSMKKKAFLLGFNFEDHPLSFVDNKEVHCFKINANKVLWEALLEELKKQECDVYTVLNTINKFVSSEIHDIKTSKGKGVEFLQKKYNINKEDIIVAGDDFNDLTMFEMFFDNSYILDHEHNKQLQKMAKTTIQKLCEIANR